jgi:hypothetical protein
MLGKNRLSRISHLDKLNKLDVLDLHSNNIAKMEVRGKKAKDQQESPLPFLQLPVGIYLTRPPSPHLSPRRPP